MVSDRRHFRNPDTISRRIVRLAGRGPAALAPPAARWAANFIALAGAALLVWSGVIHLQLWADGYQGISVIGPLFLVQGVSSIVIALKASTDDRRRVVRVILLFWLNGRDRPTVDTQIGSGDKRCLLRG